MDYGVVNSHRYFPIDEGRERHILLLALRARCPDPTLKIPSSDGQLATQTLSPVMGPISCPHSDDHDGARFAAKAKLGRGTTTLFGIFDIRGHPWRGLAQSAVHREPMCELAEGSTKVIGRVGPQG
jgi:hypothetical protein